MPRVASIVIAVERSLPDRLCGGRLLFNLIPNLLNSISVNTDKIDQFTDFVIFLFGTAATFMYQPSIKDLNQNLMYSTDTNTKKAEFVFIKSEYKAYKVKFTDIVYCEGMRDYTLVHLNNKTKPLVTLQNLKTFSGRLPENEFIRVHRSYVISLNNIDCISKSEVLMGKKNIPIGESYRESFNKMIEPYF